MTNSHLQEAGNFLVPTGTGDIYTERCHNHLRCTTPIEPLCKAEVVETVHPFVKERNDHERQLHKIPNINPYLTLKGGYPPLRCDTELVFDTDFHPGDTVTCPICGTVYEIHLTG
jgi:hypothetical protein